MSEDALEVVYQSSNVGRAEVIHAALVDEGIESFLDNAHQGGFSGVLNVRLLVPAKDADRARLFIEQHESRSAPDSTS